MEQPFRVRPLNHAAEFTQKPRVELQSSAVNRTTQVGLAGGDLQIGMVGDTGIEPVTPAV